MTSKTNGGKEYKTEKYLTDLLKNTKNILLYEAPIIIRAFIKTLKYFIENAIDFEVGDILEFKKRLKAESKCWVTYRGEFITIPEHYIIKFKTKKKLRDYLNKKNKFQNVKHRVIL